MKKTIDIFCDIIDNFGDIGVVYRLGKELTASGYVVRIFVNKLEEVSKIVKSFNPELDNQSINGVEFWNLENFRISYTAETIIEAFAVELPSKYLELLDENSKLIINLEYLSGEDWIEECHLKKSFSPKPYIEKYFYMPGFTSMSGGIILDKNYLSLVENIKESREYFFNNFFKEFGITYNSDTYYINVFTYNWDFEKFVHALGCSKKKFEFFVLDNKLGLNFKYSSNIKIHQMPYMDQSEFDTLINLSDFNFIRGEESFIRAILSEKPFLWHIYKQDDLVHIDKLEAFLKRFKEHFGEHESYRTLSLAFNHNHDFSEDFLNFINKDNNSFRNFKKFIVENCNLVEKLLYFIDSRTNQNQEEI